MQRMKKLKLLPQIFYLGELLTHVEMECLEQLAPRCIKIQYLDESGLESPEKKKKD